MLVTVRFPLLLISIPVRFALHLSLWSNLRSCLNVFIFLQSARSGSGPSVQVVLVAAVLLLRSLRLLVVAAPPAALVLLQRPWLLQWVLFLATLRALLLAASAVLFSANPLGALVCCVNWGTFLPASEDAPTMAASWAAAFTFHVTAFVVTDIFYSADVVLEEGEAPRWPPKLSSSWNLRPCFSLCHSACRCPRLNLPLRPYIFFLRHVRDFLG